MNHRLLQIFVCKQLKIHTVFENRFSITTHNTVILKCIDIFSHPQLILGSSFFNFCFLFRKEFLKNYLAVSPALRFRQTHWGTSCRQRCDHHRSGGRRAAGRMRKHQLAGCRSHCHGRPLVLGNLRDTHSAIYNSCTYSVRLENAASL